METSQESLDVLLIANDEHRIGKLTEALQEIGVDCSLRQLAQSEVACAYLHRRRPYKDAAQPDLVFYDLADTDTDTVNFARDIAFGELRSEAPVVLLTSPKSEPMLESGEIDDGKAIMFSPRSLHPFLKKLIGPGRQDLLWALRTFYQYGPTLIRQPDEFLTDNLLYNHYQDHNRQVRMRA